MEELRSWFAEGTKPFVVRLAGSGAVAGVASWGLLFALHLAVGTPRPRVSSLLLAVVLGVIVGTGLGAGLTVFWRHQVDREDRRET